MKGNFKKLINGPKPVLIDFHALWCGPCKMMAPILKELAGEVDGKVRIIKIDIDKNQSLASAYQVKSVPTLALFNKGELLWRESGSRSKGELLQVIESHTEALK